MAVDSATTIAGFDTSKPTASDLKSEGDDNLRHIKTVLKTCFPAVAGAVAASDVELSYVDGVTSSIQTQLDAKAPLASPALTGTPTAPTAAAGTNTTQIATMAALQTAVAGATGSTGLLTPSASNSAAVALTSGQHDFASYSSGAVTWTLPASPSFGATVAVTPLNDRTDNVLARNGSNIMGLAEDMTIDNANATVTVRYSGASKGWRVI